MQRANLGNLSRGPSHSDEPRVERPKKEKKVEEKVETKPAQPTEVSVEIHREAKPKIDKDPWALSPTTINQKYSKKSGKQRVFKAVDENKVSVGSLPINTGSIQDVLSGFGVEQAPKTEEIPEENQDENNK